VVRAGVLGGAGFLAFTQASCAAQVEATVDSRFALHPECASAVTEAGGPDVRLWALGADCVEATFADLTERNHRRADDFRVALGSSLPDGLRAWPERSSGWTTGIVSLVGRHEALDSLHRRLRERGIRCSLIPGGGLPQPRALAADESCLRFSFHDGKTGSADVDRLVRTLRELL